MKGKTGGGREEVGTEEEGERERDWRMDGWVCGWVEQNADSLHTGTHCLVLCYLLLTPPHPTPHLPLANTFMGIGNLIAWVTLGLFQKGLLVFMPLSGHNCCIFLFTLKIG